MSATPKPVQPQAFIATKVRYQIAEELDIPNERICPMQVAGSSVFFHVLTATGQVQISWSCSTVRNGSALKKNSLRVWN